VSVRALPSSSTLAQLMPFLLTVWLFCDEFEPLLLDDEDDDPPCEDELELVDDDPLDEDEDFCPPFVSATCC
jgi:hypothetical protein